MTKYKIQNPYNNELLSEIEYSSEEQVLSALTLLEVGKKIQSDLPPFERSNILHKLADLLKRDKEKIAQQITLEMGKTITDSLVEVDRAIATAIYAAQEAIRIKGETVNTDAFAPKRDKTAIIQKFPIGIVLAITPFNFPVNLAVHKIAPAFAAGNCILFKPGPQNYLSGKMLTDLCHEAGFAKEIIQIVNPDIPVMSMLTAHPSINCVSFTGGVVAAKAIAKNAILKKQLFELGGNDPLILMEDGDLELAVKTAINMRFGTAGQRCTAAKKVFIHNSQYEQFKKRLVEEAGKLVVGDPMKKETFIGPVVNAKAAEIVFSRIQNAIAEGAKPLLGNKRDGNIIYPTILENVSKKSELICDETFGPVIPLMTFNDIDDVLAELRLSSFGLQAGIFTNNLAVIKKVYQELEVGAVIVNDGPGFRAEHLPFGGMKESGLGREGVAYAMEAMSVIKTLIL